MEEKVIQALQDRIVVEQESSQLYFAIAQWLDFKGWFGAAKLFNKYAEEEAKHARRVCDYLLDRDVQPIISELAKPEVDVETLKDVVDKGLEHEIFVTEQYKELAKMCGDDYNTYVFALEIVKEQTEEERKMINWRDRLSVVPDWKVDEEMGE